MRAAIERLEDQDPAETMADEMRRTAVERFAHETHEALHVRLERAAAAIGEDPRHIAVARQPRRHEQHRGARHPQAGQQHDLMVTFACLR